MLVDTLVLSQLYALPMYMGALIGSRCYVHALVAAFCNHAVQIICGLQKYDNISAARRCLGWLPFHLLVQHHALNLMYILTSYLRQLSSAMYVQYINPPFQFGINKSYGLHISVTFSV